MFERILNMALASPNISAEYEKFHSVYRSFFFDSKEKEIKGKGKV